MSARLTDRQRLFVAAFAVDPDPARAARAAGYSPKTAARTGRSLLRKPAVAQALAETRAKSESIDPDRDGAMPADLAERILREDAAVAFADPRACFGPDGAPLPPADLPADIARAVSSVECKETTAKNGTMARTWKYAFWSKEKALERLARNLGLAGRDPEKGRRAVVNFVMDLGGMPDDAEAAPKPEGDGPEESGPMSDGSEMIVPEDGGHAH